MPRIGIVSVHYYPQYLPRSLAAVSQLARKADAEILVCVANNPEIVNDLQKFAQQSAPHSVKVHLHDNQGLEFGAYQAGLTMLLGLDLDWIVFANDTFSVHSCFSRIYRRHLIAAFHAPEQTLACSAGQVEALPRAYSIAGRRTNRWLTTSIFALNRSSLRLLGNQLYTPEIDELIRHTPDVVEFFSPNVDPVLAAHVKGWLFGGAENTWYGAEPLTDSNSLRFANKARSILQEKYIAAVLDDVGARFVDIRASSAGEKIVKRCEEFLFNLRGSQIKARPSEYGVRR